MNTVKIDEPTWNEIGTTELCDVDRVAYNSLQMLTAWLNTFNANDPSSWYNIDDYAFVPGHRGYPGPDSTEERPYASWVIREVEGASCLIVLVHVYNGDEGGAGTLIITVSPWRETFDIDGIVWHFDTGPQMVWSREAGYNVSLY